jgi:hypothetical protein
MRRRAAGGSSRDRRSPAVRELRGRGAVFEDHGLAALSDPGLEPVTAASTAARAKP